MLHEVSCPCCDQPRVAPEARNVDEMWQPAVAIAGSVRAHTPTQGKHSEHRTDIMLAVVHRSVTA